ncbi:MAG: hypothetical protein R2742_13350 [Micropruina glycogenica]
MNSVPHRDAERSVRYGVEDRAAEACDHQNGDQHALPDHQAHGLQPGHLRRDGVRHHGIQTEAGGRRDRKAGVGAHQNGRQAGDQRSSYRDGGDGGALVGVGRSGERDAGGQVAGACRVWCR